MQLEKNTPEIPQLNVFQKILQLDLVLEGAFVPGTCNLYYRGGWCVPLQGLTLRALLLDLTAEGAFVLWSLQLLL